METLALANGHVQRPEAQEHRIDVLTKVRLARSLSCLPSPYVEPGAFRDRAFDVFADLPAGVRRALARLRHHLSAPGALLVRNLPEDAWLPPTPPQGKRAVDKESFVSEACLVGIAQYLGEPFSYVNEKEGELVHNVCPVRHREHALSNEGSTADFRLHVEAAPFRYRPHYLGLYCLRASRSAPAVTTVAAIGDAIRLLSEASLRILRQPLFRIQEPASFGRPGEALGWSPPGAVIRGPEAFPEVWLDFNAMEALAPEAARALGELEAALLAPGVIREHVLAPGDLLLVDNRKCVHGRRSFQPRYDGADRWLQRVYIHTDPRLAFDHRHEGVRTWQLRTAEMSSRPRSGPHARPRTG